MAKNITLKHTFDPTHTIPSNWHTDANWYWEHHRALNEQFVQGVLLIFQKQVIGFGTTIAEAQADGEATLAARTDIQDNSVIHAFMGVVGPTPPFPLRNLKSQQVNNLNDQG